MQCKGRLALREQTSQSERHEFGLQTSPKEDAVYRPNWTARGRRWTRQPLWKFSFDKRGRKRTSTHPSPPFAAAVSSNPLSFAYATWASESQTFGRRLNTVKDQTSIYSTSYEYAQDLFVTVCFFKRKKNFFFSFNCGREEGITGSMIAEVEGWGREWLYIPWLFSFGSRY